MYSKRSASYGLNTNVSLDPSATSNSKANSNQSISNHIVIQATPATSTEKKDSETSPTPTPASTTSTTAPVTGLRPAAESVTEIPASALPPAEDSIYPPVYPSILTSSVQERSVDISSDTTDIQSTLLEIYEEILLTQNKQLLANILSKNSIIISKSDLERVIQAKIGYSCTISTETETGCGCCARLTGISKVDQIKIDYNDTVVDFKNAFNSAYNELVNTYKLSMKYVVT